MSTLNKTSAIDGIGDTGPLPNPYGSSDSDTSDETTSIPLSSPMSIPYIRNNSPSFHFDLPFMAHVGLNDANRDTPQNTESEEQDVDYAETFRRIQQDLHEAALHQSSMLSDLGLGYEDTTSLPEHKDHTRLLSTVHELNACLQPRPELWEHLEDENAKDVEDPLGNWPARLLHVSSMTSFKWQPGNVYGGVKEPSYAIISYTWGRWRLSSYHDPPNPALQVSGISWKVPPINPDLFSVTELEKVLRKIASVASCEMVWIDIACIDQNDGFPEGAREIGRQAKIFDNAYRSFIWLVNDSGASYSSSIMHLLRVLETASEQADSAHRQWFFEHAFPASSSTENQEEGQAPWVEFPNYEWIGNASYAISSLASIPWFSSTWTLQEAFLKPSSIFIERDGDCATSRNGHVYTLNDMLGYCKQLHQLFSLSRLSFGPLEDRDEVSILKRGLVRVIERAGLQALADRDRVSLYACAQSRTASCANDRIYGIMQVWGFNLGKSAPAADTMREWALQDLELELGKRLLREYPLESQLHVHTSAVAGRQSWRISGCSATPLHTLQMLPSGHVEGKLDRHSSRLGVRMANGLFYAHYAGKLCSFDCLRRAWTFVSHYDTQSQERLNCPSPVRISLDSTVVLNQTTLQAPYSLQDVPDDKQISLSNAISAIFDKLGRRVSVLLLGTIAQCQYEVELTKAVGVIVMNAPDEIIGGWEKRLGICIWDVLPPDSTGSSEYQNAISILSADSPEWDSFECLLG